MVEHKFKIGDKVIPQEDHCECESCQAKVGSIGTVIDLFETSYGACCQVRFLKSYPHQGDWRNYLEEVVIPATEALALLPAAGELE